MTGTQNNEIRSTSNLFYFFIHDGEGQSLLGIGDGSLGKNLHIELLNSKQQPIGIEPLANKDNSQKYHFEISFRPGTLLKKNLNKITFKPQSGCKMQPTESGDSFYFIYEGTKKIELATNEKLIFILENISAEPGGGSRGTRVELKYTNITWLNNSISGTQLQYLNIVNQLGSKQIPLAVNFIGSSRTIKRTDVELRELKQKKTINTKNNAQKQAQEREIKTEVTVVGSNRILNDGTPNELILAFHYVHYLQNPAEKTDVGLSLRGSENYRDDASNFKISFDILPDKAEDTGYGLLRKSAASQVEIKTEPLDSETWEASPPNTQGKSPQWTVTCKKDQKIESLNELLKLKISGLKTNLQAGSANLYIYYENIPGYWDGYIICPIEKGPLTLVKGKDDTESVGIGTNAPIAKLHVEQKVGIAMEDKDKGNRPALVVDQKGKGYAIYAKSTSAECDWSTLVAEQNGTGHAIWAVSTSDSLKESKNSTLQVDQKGIGYAIYARSTLSKCDWSTLVAEQNGTGHAIWAVSRLDESHEKTKTTLHIDQHGKGNAIFAKTTLPDSDNSTLVIEQSGKGHAIRAESFSGECKNPTLYILQHGNNNAIFAKTTLPDSDHSTLVIEQSGKGHAIRAKSSSDEYAALDVKQLGKAPAASFMGDVVVNGELSYNTCKQTSSREIKENIASLSTEEAITTLEQLNPVKYDYKGKHAFRKNLGFIAEEMPDNVASYDRKTISPFEVVPILTKVVQEQQKTIILLQEEVNQLKTPHQNT